MAPFKIVCWNIQDLGTDQVNDKSFLDMVTEVIHQSGAHLACILETKADEGGRLGTAIQGLLNAKASKPWASHSSTQSGPKSNKPENYVFLWQTKVATMSGFAFPNMPVAVGKKAAPGFINTHIKSRFPYLGTLAVNKKTITIVAFHTCFETVDIVESNQNLEHIPQVRAHDNVILMGDFNDKVTGGRKKRRGFESFEPLYNLPDAYAWQVDEKTSLQTKKGAAKWTTTAEARASCYDHFFWRSKKNQFSIKSAGALDLLADVQHPNYLHDLGKAVFNNWAKRKNTQAASPVAQKQRSRSKRPAWVNIPAFGPTDKITTVQQAHQVYSDGVSDHIPIFLEINV